MKTLLLTLTLLFVGHKSFSQDWVYAGADSDGDKWYVKSTFVKKEENFGGSGESIRIWTKKEINKKTIRKGGKTLTYANVKELQLIIADCSDRKLKFVTTTVYDSKGKVIHSWTLQDYEQEWSDVVPDSMGEAMLNKICELFN